MWIFIRFEDMDMPELKYSFESMSDEAKSNASRIISINSIVVDDLTFLLSIVDDESQDFDVRIQAIKVVGYSEVLKNTSECIESFINIAINKNDDLYVRVESLICLSFSNFGLKFIDKFYEIIIDEDDELDVRYAAFDALARQKTYSLGMEKLNYLLENKEFGKHVRIELHSPK